MTTQKPLEQIRDKMALGHNEAIKYFNNSSFDQCFKNGFDACAQYLNPELEKINNEYYEMKIAYKEKLDNQRGEITKLKSVIEVLKEGLAMVKDKAPFCDCMDAPAIANDTLSQAEKMMAE